MPPAPRAEHERHPADLHGVWRLVSFHEVDRDDEVEREVLGPDPDGLLIYSADGYMSVSMMPSRTRDGVEFMGYAGSWAVRDGHVVHHIEVSARPDWVGTDQIRRVQLTGDRLVLRATAETAGRRLRTRLIWQRASHS